MCMHENTAVGVSRSACPTLPPHHCSPPGSSARGISLARMLERGPRSAAGDHPDPAIEPESPLALASAGDSTA